MKPGCYLSLLAYLVISAAATGQEPAQLQFVRALKNEYGAKLADDYLRRLQQTPEYTPRLALEAALLKRGSSPSRS